MNSVRIVNVFLYFGHFLFGKINQLNSFFLNYLVGMYINIIHLRTKVGIFKQKATFLYLCLMQATIKKCPRCGKIFSCEGTKDCWCEQLQLDKKLLEFLRQNYSDCLCLECLESLQKTALQKRGTNYSRYPTV
jgi:hypothetical protein